MLSHGRRERVSARGITSVLLCGVVLIVAAMAGCNAGSASSGGYVDRYNHGEYAAAKIEAETAYKTATGPAREQAALIAGLSSQSLSQTSDAKRYLRPLLGSRDAAISGRAGASLGLIARSEGDKANAAKLLSDAAPKLAGDESAKAAMFAGDMYQSMGMAEAASTQYAAAKQVAMSTTLQQQLQDRMAGKKFTVQVGAFGNKANAEKRAREMGSKSATMGLGQPRVVQGMAGGRSMFLVQIGEFALRQDAASAMKNLSVPEGRVAEVN